MRWLFLLLVLCFVSCKINRKQNNIPYGKWKYITKDGNNVSRIQGKYDRLGNEKGIWRYYHNDTLHRVEKYYYPFCVNVLYNQNGKIYQIGKSVSSNKSWTKYDVWYHYDSKQNLIDSVNYNQN